MQLDTRPEETDEATKNKLQTYKKSQREKAGEQRLLRLATKRCLTTTVSHEDMMHFHRDRGWASMRRQCSHLYAVHLAPCEQCDQMVRLCFNVWSFLRH